MGRRKSNDTAAQHGIVGEIKYPLCGSFDGFAEVVEGLADRSKDSIEPRLEFGVVGHGRTFVHFARFA